MRPKYFEEFDIGGKFVSPGKTVTDTDLTLMVGLCRYAHPMFLDDEFARTTVFGKRILPGVQTISLMQGLAESSDAWDITAVVGMVGLDNAKFKAPVVAGDTLKVEVEIINKMELKKPDKGLIVFKQTCLNQRGESVVEVELTLMFLRKP